MDRLSGSKKRPSEIAELLIALRDNYVERMEALDELLEETTEESFNDALEKATDEYIASENFFFGEPLSDTDLPKNLGRYHLP